MSICMRKLIPRLNKLGLITGNEKVNVYKSLYDDLVILNLSYYNINYYYINYYTYLMLYLEVSYTYSNSYL